MKKSVPRTTGNFLTLRYFNRNLNSNILSHAGSFPMTNSANPSPSPEPQWKPIGRNMRRVFGVLIEKAKTTPDNYPMTISALISGCKQKSNRDPLMDLDEDEVLEALDKLRGMGAVREVQGSGRVNKYRHCAYEWLAVNAPQSAVMTELLLRGPQTLGELRARASRMEPFENLEVLSAVVTELQAKGLVEALTPAGRGQTFGHTLYEPHERQKAINKAEAVTSAAVEISAPAQTRVAVSRAAETQIAETQTAGTQAHESRSDGSGDLLAELLAEVKSLRARVDRLESELGLS